MTDYHKFHQLHHRTKPLILPNVWSPKSAQLVESNGFEAIATSSGAIAETLGYADGEKIPFDELLYMVRRIKASTSLPLTVDFERGYTDDPIQLTTHVQQLLDTGVAGINLEDAQGDDTYLKKLSAIKNFLSRTNQHLFINARTDGFLQKLPSPLETTLRRAKTYEDAGADGLFVTAVQDPEIIKQIAGATRLPLNVVAIGNVTSFDTLAASGVRRISMAVFLYRATYRETDAMLKNVIRDNGTTTLFQPA